LVPLYAGFLWEQAPKASLRIWRPQRPR